MSITQEQLDYWAAEALADAEAELNAKIQESLTPEIRRVWLACQEWLDEHTPF